MFRLQASMQGAGQTVPHTAILKGVYSSMRSWASLTFPSFIRLKKTGVGIPEGQAAAQGGVRLKWWGLSSFTFISPGCRAYRRGASLSS